jgi:TolB-like protein/DNA-binding winged helix-turn-helix (wHTH) protein/Tfp pilus assembly protein PilF
MKSSADIAANHALEQGFQLGDLRVDPLDDEVSGPNGRERLDPKVMDVLVLLAQHAGHIVLREDLFAQLWPNTVVTDDALTRCIYELRRHLNQAGGDESYKAMLETLPKRGYRLNGEIVPARKPAGSASGFRPLRRVAALAAAILIAALLWLIIGQRVFGPTVEPPSLSADGAAPSIAVLPFVDMSAGQDQGFLSDGISEEILNRLAQIPALRVIARTSSFAFRGQQAGIPEIAAKLNVSHVLEGSIRRSGDSLRITAQLISASDSSHAWLETYDRELSDLFAVQDEIAASVARALQIQLADVNRGSSRPVSAQAHEKFLQGQFFYNRRAPGDSERAAQYYEEAVAIDPGYARAWAALSGAYSLLAWDGQTLIKDLQKRQGEAAHKAAELDPRLAVAHARLARFYYETEDYEKAKEHEREAVALDPDDPLVLGYTSGNALARGDFDEAIAMQRRALAQDPLASTHRTNLAVLLLADGQLDVAKSEFRRALELRPDAGLKVNVEIVRILVLQRRYDEAQSAIARFPESKLRDHGLALLYQAPGRLADADAALKRLAAQSGDTMDSIRLAEVYAFRGLSDEAFAALQERNEMLKRPKDWELPRIWNFQDEMRLSPFLKPLHADPRWEALMAKPD